MHRVASGVRIAARSVPTARQFASLREKQGGESKFNPKAVLKSVEGLSVCELAIQWAVLRTMRIKQLHPLAKSMIKISSTDTLAGKAATHFLKPWFNPFCAIGNIDEVVRATKARGLDPKSIIFDYGTEYIREPGEREVTEKQYLSYLMHPDVTTIAVKYTGLCRAEALGDPTRYPEEVHAAQAALMRVVEAAHKANKLVVIDAEDYKSEQQIERMALFLAIKFPKNVMLTVQATRKDSVERLASWVNQMPPGATLICKVVKGAYSDDRIRFPDAFFQNFEGTHENYLKILEFGAICNGLLILPCTHNLELINWVAQQGYTEVGQLSGMQVATAVAPSVNQRLYVIAHPEQAAISEYMLRRLDEHGDALEPRREILLLEAIKLRVAGCISK